MRASTAYFVGAGTIVAAIAIGLGGGLVAGNIMNPVTPKVGPDTSKLEARAEPAAMTSAPSDRVPYLTGTAAFGAAVMPAAQAESPAASQPTSASAEPQQPAKPVAVNDAAPSSAPVTRSVEQASRKSPDKSDEKQAKAEPEPKAEAKSETKPEAKSETRVEAKADAAEPVASPENAYAKAKDTDVKRARSERRRSDRRRDWAARRHHEARDPRGRTDWDDVARNVREDADARDFAGFRRGNYPPPDRGPQIRLFGFDDD